MYLENESWLLDKCTKCTCRNGIVLCDVNKCPPVACPNPIIDPLNDECCQVCPNNETIKSKNDQPSIKLINPLTKSPLNHSDYEMSNFWSCTDSNDQKWPHESIWKENDCLHCICMNGERKCFNLQAKCPKIKCSQPILKKGHCCPYCLDFVDTSFILTNDFILNNLTSLQTS